MNAQIADKTWGRRLFTGLVALTLVAASLAGFATDRAAPRIVAIGDVHGALSGLTGLLEATALIDGEGRWSGGNAVLVSLGDLVDRGPESRAAMDLLRRLQTEAAAAGGRVIVLLGNHEVMNLTGDLRDVSAAEIASYGGAAGHLAAFAPDGEYGEWLLGLDVLALVGETLFVHGGLSSILQGASISDVNARVRQSLSVLIRNGKTLQDAGILVAGPDGVDLLTAAFQIARKQPPHELTAQAVPAELRAVLEEFVSAGESALFGINGPLWYRGTALCHPLLESSALQNVLDHYGAKRVVLGHTPTARRSPALRQGGRAVAIDTGMLTSVYRGAPYALVIEEDMFAIGADGIRSPVLLEAERSEQIAELLRTGNLVQNPEDRDSYRVSSDSDAELSVAAVFRKVSRKKADRALAAFRLDQHLGLQMVPPLAQREISGSSGLLVEAVPRLTERARQEQNRVRPAYCEAGSDYLLLAAFDAVIGKTNRGVDDFAFRRRDWRILATDNEDAFGTGTRLPVYAQKPALPAGMAERLVQLTEESLNSLLGDLLKPREIKAILKRRDLVLRWPREDALR